MHVSYLSVALFAMLGASVQVPEDFPGLQPSQIPADTGADQANRYQINYRFRSSGQVLEIITVKDVQNIGTPPQQSPYNNRVWAGTNLRPVCPLFCSDATADVNVRGINCLGPCRVPHLDPNILYITSGANTFVGAGGIIYCPDQTRGVICSTQDGNPTVDYSS